MLGMGLSLTIDDFKRIFKYPKAASIGLFNQLILLPIVAYILIILFDVSPIFAVGVMLLAACPGGTTSNLISHVSKGDTALSITLTAICSLVAVISIPLITQFALDNFLESSTRVILPFGQTVLQIFAITILPVSIGMLVRSKKDSFALRMDKPVRVASIVIFLAILVSIIANDWDTVTTYFPQLGVITLALNVVTMAIGYFASTVGGLNLREKITVTIESGVQNGTLAIVIANTILMNGDYALPAAIYSLMMFVTGGFMMFYFGRREAA